MKLTHIDRKKIVAALQAGKPAAELSSKYGVTAGHVVTVYREVTGSNLTPFKRLSHSEKEAIVAELLAKKATVGDLAARYGVTPSAISYIYKARVGRPFKPQPSSKLSSQDKKTIIAELAANNATIKELANRYEVPRETISKIFRKHTGKSFGAPHLPSKVKATIVTELQSGKVSMTELATRYGVHPDTISRTFKQKTGKSFRPRRLSQEVKMSHSSSHKDIVQLITKLVQENPNRKIIFDLKKKEISLQ